MLSCAQPALCLDTSWLASDPCAPKQHLQVLRVQQPAETGLGHSTTHGLNSSTTAAGSGSGGSGPTPTRRPLQQLPAAATPHRCNELDRLLTVLAGVLTVSHAYIKLYSSRCDVARQRAWPVCDGAVLQDEGKIFGCLACITHSLLV
jgi:hypothetical protein